LERFPRPKLSYNTYKSYTKSSYITYKYDRFLSYIPYKYGKESTSSMGARRDFKERLQVRGLGTDRGEAHQSLSSQQWFTQGTRMCKGAGHRGA